MNFSHLNFHDFINDFINQKKQGGSLIKKLINNSNRILLNLPILGPARKISSKLSEESFSEFYRFERALSHKLHPILYNNGLNFICSNKIENIFFKKYDTYENIYLKNLPRENDYATKFKNLLTLKNMIIKMVKNDGHFMVIKFCDYLLSNNVKELSDRLKKVEFAINYLKKNTTGDESHDMGLVTSKFNQFKEKFGEEDGDLFIERLSWENMFLKFALKLEKFHKDKQMLNAEEVKTGEGESFDVFTNEIDTLFEDRENEKKQEEPEKNEISNNEKEEDSADNLKNYANQVKKSFLDAVNENDEKKIQAIIDSIYSNNNKKFGEEKAEEILKELLNIWINDSTIEDWKKDIFKQILADKENPTQKNIPEGVESKFEIADESSDQLGEFNIAEDTDDRELGKFDIASDSVQKEPEELDIADLINDQASGNFEIADDTGSKELEKFEIAAVSDEKEPGEFDITDLIDDQASENFEIADTSGKKELGDFDIADITEDQLLKEFDIAEKEESQLGHFEITEDTDEPEAGHFQIAEQETTELSKHKTTDERSDEVDNVQLQHFSIDTKKLEITNEDLKNFDKVLIQKEEELKTIEKKIVAEAGKTTSEINELREIHDPDEAINKSIKMLYNENYNQYHQVIINVLEDLDDNKNVIIKIIRKLEDGPFKTMTIGEKNATIDLLLKKYKSNTEITGILINYKKEINTPSKIIKAITNHLRKLEKKYPDKKECMARQLNYLSKLLGDTNYSPAWRTVKILYKNILLQNKGGKREIFKDISKQPPWKQVELYNYLKKFYHLDKTVIYSIESRLKEDPIKQIAERIYNETTGEQPDINNFFKSIEGEYGNFDEWIEKNIIAHDDEGEEDNSIEASQVDINKTREEVLQQVQKMDLTDGPSSTAFKKNIKSLIQYNTDEALVFLESIVNNSNIDPIVKNEIINNYNKSDDESFKKLHDIHTLLGSIDSVEEKIEIIQNFSESLGQDGREKIILDSVKQKLELLSNEEKIKKTDTKINEIFLKNKDADKEQLLNKVAVHDKFPSRVKNTARQIIDSTKNDKFDEAVTSICTSTNSPEMKINFLESLKAISIKKGWINDDESDGLSQGRLKKIIDKINFYKKIINQNRKRKKKTNEKRKEIMDTLFKSQSSKKSNKKKIKDDIEEQEADTLEDKLYSKTLNIVKAYKENIDALGPILPVLLKINSNEKENYINNQVKSYQDQKKSLLSKTKNMIESSEPDIELFETIHNSTPKIQFLWFQDIIKLYQATNLEEVFKSFASNKEIFNEVIRLSRIIKNNNKDDFLKRTIEKENLLIHKIASDFTLEGIKKLKKQFSGRQDKEKLNYFRELAKIMDDLTPADIPEITPQEDKHESKPKSTDIGEMIPEKHEGDDAKHHLTPKRKSHYVEKTNKEMDIFIKLCKSDRTISLALKNDDRIYTINTFLDDLSTGKRDALDVISDNKEECIELFKTIIKKKLAASFPQAGNALKFCLANNIISRFEL